jgi:hypothetical protein
VTIRVLASLLLLSPATVLSDPKYSDIVGSWLCGPYEIKGSDFSVSAIDRTTYSADGQVTEWSTVTITMPDGTIVRTESRYEGHWTLTGDIIEREYKTWKFLSSDSPTISIAKGQASVDAQMQRKNWSKSRILEYDEQLVTIPVESMYKEAEVRVSCGKA